MSNTPTTPVLHPGKTCWKIARADRLAVIIDAEDYFATVRAAIQKARHSILLIGWDFDTRIMLDRPSEESEVPNKLGQLLTWAAKKNPELQIYLLRWNLGAINALGRGTTPLVILDWMTNERIHFKLDSAHPLGSAHHQKIVVIDDTLAFCGGIDMTGDRWDTREHLDKDPRRVRPSTKRPYGPWHDVSTAVDGEVARALGELARERWRRATGEQLEAPPRLSSSWPEGLTPSFRNVDVAIARTAPEYDGREPVYEIEALYLAAIAAARSSIYIESQYFASGKIAKAIAGRLRQPDAPEIVVVNPETGEGWLEEEVMGSSRAHFLDLVKKADLHDRFRLYTPVTAGRQPIYVHAKVMVVDDYFLKVGSSNLNNRSLGFDTECDLAIDVSADAEADPATRRSIVALRNDLIAEHLGVEVARFEESLAQAEGSLIKAIEGLMSDGRSLVLFVPPDVNAIEEALMEENGLLDPERPSTRWRGVRRGLKSVARIFRRG